MSNNSNSERFHFVFEGLMAQFHFFQKAVDKKVPNAGLSLDNYDEIGFHCSVINDCEVAFKIGITIGACYAHFGRLGKKEVKPDEQSDNPYTYRCAKWWYFQFLPEPHKSKAIEHFDECFPDGLSCYFECLAEAVNCFNWPGTPENQDHKYWYKLYCLASNGDFNPSTNAPA